MFNTLDGYIRLVKTNIVQVNTHEESSIRINRVGDSLERYVKDGFCNILDKDLDDNKRQESYNEIFSYTGTQNQPPDLMIKAGDAIEVKKFKSLNPREIQLNSSPPRVKLSSEDPMLSERARNCENWIQKDVVYCLGSVINGIIKELWFVYGNCFVSSSNIYKELKNSVKETLESGSYNMSPTNELGRINNVDPLGYSSFRIRNMWLLKHPKRMFVDYTNQTSSGFYLIVRNEKYDTFDQKTIEELKLNKEITTQDITVEDPDNPSETIECKILKYEF
tara:strand:- start:187 stop:1020 length:834 start_codon:yes stop_codon:yes gene_type:complete